MPVTEPELTTNKSAVRVTNAVSNVLALLLAAIATGGSLYLSMGLGPKACPLCFYQRSFAMGAVLVLIAQIWLDGIRSTRAAIVILPLAVSGLGIAAFHVYLVQAGKLECPPAMFDWGDGPLQSLALFIFLTLVCLAGGCSSRHAERSGGVVTIVAVTVLGGLAAWACIASAPSLPPAPEQPYDPVEHPFIMCRPPFPGA